MQQELLLFCRTFLAGATLALSYDLLLIFRNTVPHSSFLTGIEDLIYWCGAGLFLFSVLYLENNGVIRLYALLGTILGAFVFQLGPGRILVKYLSAFFRKIQRYLGILGGPMKKWRKRLKFYFAGVKISLYEQKPIQRSRKRENEKKKEKKKESSEKKRND